MEHAHTAFRDAAASLLRAPSSRSRVWAPGAWAIENHANTTGGVIELPLFTLAPRWFEYYAYIGVGSPPQYMRVVLDTMSSDLSLLSYDRSHHEMYDHAKSTSYVANNTLVRTALPGTDDVALGVLSQDHITFNQDLRLLNQSFTELLDRVETIAYFEDTLADGWLGLSRSPTQEAFPVASLVGRLMNGNELREPVIGIHLNPLSTGLVTFGGVNRHLFEGELRWIDVLPLVNAYTSSSTLWSFRLDGVEINGKPVTTTQGEYTGGSAVLDAVLPMIVGPRDVVDSINRALGQDEGLRVPCAGAKGVPSITITLVLGGNPFVLKRDDLVIAAQHGPGCVSLFAPASSKEAPWVVGAPFLQAFYTALDYGDVTRAARLGFARSKRDTPPSFSAYDSLWLVLLVLVVVLILRSIGRKRIRRTSAAKIHEHE